MFDVTNFLMRWLFLSNLVRDAPDIQSLSCHPGIPSTKTVTESSRQNNHYIQDTRSGYTTSSSISSFTIFQRPQSTTDTAPPPSASTSLNCEDMWRDQCFRAILSYPPGTQRLLIIDAMRNELVERLSCSLERSDNVMKRQVKYNQFKNEYDEESINEGAFSFSKPASESGRIFIDEDNRYVETGNSDVDREEHNQPFPQSSSSSILRPAEKETNQQDSNYIQDRKEGKFTREGISLTPPLDEEMNDAHKTLRVVRDYLPQLVSVVLKSPPAFDHNLVDPIEKLRRLIVRKCIDDANWGVDMCWLLEAEVGRAWKHLFEHRQQTGKRLIIVLPADKAAVMATIGSGKKEAFDLLQDAEQATAFGFTNVRFDNHSVHGAGQFWKNGQSEMNVRREVETINDSKLPSSLSLRRCSHFGDTMHFIDRLTKISLDMRGVPIIHRHSYLQDSLKETNRRMRRRMITRGDVSLDVEDSLGPNDWPSISDIASDMLMYSVHLPVDPKQNNRWPGGTSTEYFTNEGAVRILNIVVDESRILASRERCPFLVRVEVAETNLRGNDSRLYASGAVGLGATIKEAIFMSASRMNDGVINGESKCRERFENYHIPSELLLTSSTNLEKQHRLAIVKKKLGMDPSSKEMLKGGWQADETLFYSQNPEAIFATSPYDVVRETEYQHLHQQMYSDHSMAVQTIERSHFSTGQALLNKIFGQPWDDKCEEIRQASPYGEVEGWRLASFIIKAGEDIRREALVMQIITKLDDWFKSDIPELYRPHMRPYTIMCVGGDAGLVECLSDAKSVDEVKKGADHFQSLRDYFERAYGDPTTCTNFAPYNKKSLTFEEAQDNFLRSLVGYSLICYILQIKDRHNANILMDRDGNIIHIDFGFVLGDTPKMCKVPIFYEKAPFKLSNEYWEVLGGWNVNQGGLGVRFCHMFEHAFACAASHVEEIASLVEATMLTLTQSTGQARLLADGVRNRLKMRGPPGSTAQKSFIMELVNAARTDKGTSTYDWLQRNMNGYQ